VQRHRTTRAVQKKSSNPDDLCNGAEPRRHQLTPFRFSVETIFRRRRKRPETKAAYLLRQPDNGDRHVGPYPKRDLPQIPHHRTSGLRPPRGNAMTETVMALSVFFSVSIFLAHAFDAYRMR
jgi:hypothetical protein